MRPATIYIPPALKTRWVSQAQASGMKLTDWLELQVKIAEEYKRLFHG